MNTGSKSTLLHRKVTGNLTPLVGERLLEVAYWCINMEASAETILDPEFYFGGEVELRFTSRAPVYVTWDESAGWEDHFSVQVRRESAFLPNTLQRLEASPSPQWKNSIGQVLRECSVLGWCGVPHVVVFHFDQAVLVGDGYQKERFGDCDDVLIRTEKDAAKLPFMSEIEVLWTSSKS